MENRIIGREKEIGRLKQYISSPNSEFIVIYGRRRIGKTFLVKELFEDNFVFRITGLEKASKKQQLLNFHYTLNKHTDYADVPKNWTEAFNRLQAYVEQKGGEESKIVFFDELPWFDTPSSNFLSAFDHFWNDWAFYRNDIKLIVCGSATSWILNKIINGRGGMHNRATHKMLLQPFTLRQTQDYFNKNGFFYGTAEIIDCYMAVGGVAYYLSLFDKEVSVAENINNLCFEKGGELINEYNRIFKSLYKHPEKHIEIVKVLQTKNKGLTRNEIAAETGFAGNGKLSTVLKELEECDFIRSFSPFGKSKKEKLYQLIDPFILFYDRFMKGHSTFSSGYWGKMQQTQAYKTWCGYAFEIVCLIHIDSIINALKIGGLITEPCSWVYVAPKTGSDDPDLNVGAQIDLLIDRSDKCINVCEIKYSTGLYDIDKAYDLRIQQRLRTFQKVTNTQKSLISTFITPFGLTNNAYSRRVGKQITGAEIFQ